MDDGEDTTGANEMPAAVIEAAARVKEIKRLVDQTWNHAARPAVRAIDECRRLSAENHALKLELYRDRGDRQRATAAAAEAAGVDLQELRAFVDKRRHVTIRDRSLQSGYRYACALLALLEATPCPE